MDIYWCHIADVPGIPYYLQAHQEHIQYCTGLNERRTIFGWQYDDRTGSGSCWNSSGCYW